SSTSSCGGCHRRSSGENKRGSASRLAVGASRKTLGGAVDEYLSEKEQIELIREWFRENGWYLVAGVAIAALGIFGYKQYREYVESRAEAAAALYLDLQDVLEDDDRTAAEALLAELRESYPGSPYTDQAGLLMAGSLLVRDTNRAAEELRYVMQRTKDRELGLIARLRLARVLIHQSSADEALQVLAVNDVGPFAAQFAELRGGSARLRDAAAESSRARADRAPAARARADSSVVGRRGASSARGERRRAVRRAVRGDSRRRALCARGSRCGARSLFERARGAGGRVDQPGFRRDEARRAR